jgi:transposase
MARHAAVRVTVGVDTHKDAHVARAKDQLGRLLGDDVALGPQVAGQTSAVAAGPLDAECRLLAVAPRPGEECTCARLRAGTLVDPTTATKVALRSLALRHQALETETRVLEAQLARLTAGLAPELLAVFGVGTDSAGALLVAAGDDPRRLRSEAAFAMLCGASPVEASSGKVTRHRLNRGGDREANCALYHIVMVRLRWHQPTKDYMARRTTEGKSKREIIRCLKRYVAREAYAVLRSMQLSDDATGQARAEVA